MSDVGETLSWSGSEATAFVCPRCGAGAAVGGVCPTDGTRRVALELDHALIGQVVDARFEVMALLGTGGMGAVYRAMQRSVGREVALKVVRRARAGDANAVMRFFREARAVSRLRHPNTVTLYDFGQSDDGLLWMAMELLEGRELSDELSGGQRLAPERAVRIAVQICDSLAEAHDVGLIHRDLKPENLMLVQRHGHADFVKVLDFGIAKALVGEGGASTATGLITGTPAYMSPEGAQGLAVDARADLYSVGVVLYQMLEGRLPFVSSDPLATLRAHVDTPPPPLTHAPTALAAVVTQLLAKAPDARPRDAVSLRAQLLDALSRPATTPLPPVPPRRALPWLGLLALGAVVGLAVWLGTGPAQGPEPPAGPAAPVSAAVVSAAPVSAAVVPEAVVPEGVAAAAATAGPAAAERAPPPAAPTPSPSASAASPPGPPAVPAPALPAHDTPFLIRPDERDEAPASRRAPLLSPRARVHVESTPAGAALLDGRERLCATPCDVPVWDGPRALVLRAAGFRDRPLTLDGTLPTVNAALARSGRGLVPL